MPDAAMQFLHEDSEGRKWYFADSSFTRPGIYFWDEARQANIHVEDELFLKSDEPPPFVPEQLDFTRTSDFHHESYDFDEEAEKVAKRKRLIVVYPEKNQLQIDVDSEPQRLEVYRRLPMFFWDESYKIVEKPSASGKPGHVHITLTLERELTEWQRIALQSVLASDPMREFLNAMRAFAGNERATRLFERPTQVPGQPL